MPVIRDCSEVKSKCGDVKRSCAGGKLPSLPTLKSSGVLFLWRPVPLRSISKSVDVLLNNVAQNRYQLLAGSRVF